MLLLLPHADCVQALDKAKEAARKERMLCKQREQAQLTEQINFDLTYCVRLPWGQLCVIIIW